MTTINISSQSLYSSAFQPSIKSPEAETDEPKVVEPTSLDVDLSSAKTAAAQQSTSADPREQMIENLKKQIEQTQKQLEEQRAQLAAAQNSNLDEQSKAQQVMAIQMQIAATSATLQTLQGSLIQALTEGMKGGNVNTTA